MAVWKECFDREEEAGRKELKGRGFLYTQNPNASVFTDRRARDGMKWSCSLSQGYVYELLAVSSKLVAG